MTGKTGTTIARLIFLAVAGFALLLPLIYLLGAIVTGEQR